MEVMSQAGARGPASPPKPPPPVPAKAGSPPAPPVATKGAAPPKAPAPAPGASMVTKWHVPETPAPAAPARAGKSTMLGVQAPKPGTTGTAPTAEDSWDVAPTRIEERAQPTPQ